jgi:peptidoglycan/xylan/chitin deacetylase (PgdA/CDA1 family)
VLAASSFREQMRYLKTNGYRVVSLADFIEFIRLNRQLPQRAVVLTFDDGYRAFKDYAYPVLKELGFTATLFVYTDWVGAGRGALSWSDLRELSADGFDVEAHTKTHADLRRATGETEAQYARRMQAELEKPQELFSKNLGHRSQILAYPYGRWEEGLLPKVKEHGYIAAFSVRRQGNASFVRPLTGHRSQIYSEMTLDDFVRNLNVFQEENLR